MHDGKKKRVVQHAIYLVTSTSSSELPSGCGCCCCPSALVRDWQLQCRCRHSDAVKWGGTFHGHMAHCGPTTYCLKLLSCPDENNRRISCNAARSPPLSYSFFFLLGGLAELPLLVFSLFLCRFVLFCFSLSPCVRCTPFTLYLVICFSTRSVHNCFSHSACYCFLCMWWLLRSHHQGICRCPVHSSS